MTMIELAERSMDVEGTRTYLVLVIVARTLPPVIIFSASIVTMNSSGWLACAAAQQRMPPGLNHRLEGNRQHHSSALHQEWCVTDQSYQLLALLPCVLETSRLPTAHPVAGEAKRPRGARTCAPRRDRDPALASRA